MTGNTASTAANGDYTVNGVPRSCSTLTPFIVVPDAAGAVAFYRDVFGARVVGVTEFGGLIAHADLDFGNGRLNLGEAMPDYGLVPPPEGDVACYSIAVYTPDVDALVERAVAAGAVVREPATDFVSGDRFASIRDPFGVRWSVMTRIEDLSDEESAARVEQWAKEQAGD